MNKKTLVLLVLIACVITVGLAFKAKTPVPVAVQTKTPAYENTSFAIDGTLVTLKDGLSVVPIAPDSATSVTTRYFGNLASGDLNSDGVDDVAFLVTQDGGGSGTFYYVVAALKNTDGTYAGTNALLLGDRIAPQTTELHDGTIVVNFADRAAGDPLSAAPSVGVTRRFSVSNGKLQKVL